MSQELNKILLIPDVHGRTFWRKALDFKGEVIFLGDYLDPYPHEQISMDDAISEFKDIMEWGRENQNVHLLLGNHDWHYIYPELHASRKDFYYADDVLSLFESNKSLFHRYWFVGGTLFTHAGLSKGWMKWMLKTDWRDAIETADSVDLFACGPKRGGENPVSGPLWLDYRELDPDRLNSFHKDEIWLDEEVKFQIFGHTQQVKTGGIARGEGWASIDSRAVFEVDPYNPVDVKLYL